MTASGPTSGRIDVGDPLRAIDDVYGPVLGRLLGALDVGLYVFFVLSGYLIAGPFVRAFVGRSPMPAIRAYSLNRLLRIVPRFWIVFTILLVLHGPGHSSWGDVAAVYAFAQNYVESDVSAWVGPAWTLAVEIVFYALVPLCFFLLLHLASSSGDARARARVVLLSAVGVWVASIALREVIPASLQWQRTVPALVFAFMPGIVLVCLQLRFDGRLAPRRARHTARALWAGSLALWAAYAMTVPRGVFPPVAGALPAVLASLASALFVAAPMLRQWGGVAAPRVLDNAAMRWTGERSYGLYLIHQGLGATLAGWIAFSAAPRERFVEAVLVALPLSLLAAAVLFRSVEQPLLRRRRAWRHPPSGPSRAARAHPSLPADAEARSP